MVGTRLTLSRTRAKAGRVAATAALLLAGGVLWTQAGVAGADVSATPGSLYAWGSNFQRVLGDGHEQGTVARTPSEAVGITNVTHIDATGYGMAALADGTWYSWGYGPNAELCNGRQDYAVRTPQPSLIP